MNELIAAYDLDENGNAPELHPDLATYLTERAGMTMLQHPLLYQVPYFPTLAGLMNRIYAQKQKRLHSLLDENRIYEAVWLHERPWRFSVFEFHADDLSDKDYWSLAGEVWTDSENIWQNVGEWEEVLTADRPLRRLLMTKDERASLAGMNPTLTIHRGTTATYVGSPSLSWTLNRKRAEWFARRNLREGAVPLVITAQVQKSEVVAYFSRRNEDEIVAHPTAIYGRTVETLP